jgi:hypothetical protein
MSPPGLTKKSGHDSVIRNVRGKGSSRAWLALTPEPERDLPAAIAILRAGGAVSDEVVGCERARAEALVLRGSERGYLAWLAEAAWLARDGATSADPAVSRAAGLVGEVVSNQAGLLLGLPGGGRRREAARRILEKGAR